MAPSCGHFFPLLLILLISGAVNGSHYRRDNVNNGRAGALISRLQMHGGGGDYNITDKHYWVSRTITGIHGYVIAGIWLLCGVGLGSYIMIKNSSDSYANMVDHPNSSYILLFWLLIFFTALSIVASSFVVAANQGSMHKTKKLIETMLDAGSDAQQIMQRTKNILLTFQTVLSPLDSESIHMLNVTTHSLRRESVSIKQFIDTSRHSTKTAVVTLYVANLVVVVSNLVFLVAALGLSWFLTGINFFFHKFAEDTCNALEDFQQNPQNSSLQSVVPCTKYPTSNTLLVQIGSTIHNYMSQINLKLAELPALARPSETNDDLVVQEVCNPFSGAPNYTFTPDKCPTDSIPVGNLPNILSRYTCYKSSRKCRGEGKFLPEAIYDECRAYSESLQDLIDIYPDLVSLIKCSQVKQAFSDIVQFQCKPFRKAARRLWLSTLLFSICLVILTLLWAAKAYQDKGKLFSPCSIFPERV
ncbi:unnamed protein product [Cuscuta epithymum]|uniref:Uncharacterized protein n=1 Tax=Cuscuta epithymum TaxID=186058 RepID=A0AAV0E1B8_9ASTE|nr:unnamed protein product [Cuscuta epithymum]